MARITEVEALRQIYGHAKGRAVSKQMDRLDPHCRAFIALSPLVMLGSQGRDGPADVTPRGDGPGFVHVLDDRTLALPDRPGNNRLDTLVNILENPRVGLLFLVPGIDEVLRVNGSAEIRDDDDLRAPFEVRGRLPATVLVVSVGEVYFHCAKALMRADMWNPARHVVRTVFPTIGEILRDQTGDGGGAESQAEMVARYRDLLY
ncbi:MAG: pyridoxamine 5'-phosphate oxidase family protein [Hyphomicrobiales bacterium]|nr:pyridoxamine 5'-phosphate oxidase family protein [Hyphomicrobiales bacterium]MCP5370505.1 pyridoxamine 5'-phosphate oxidase family protein [Hyphomicrobiales bacterium]